ILVREALEVELEEGLLVDDVSFLQIREEAILYSVGDNRELHVGRGIEVFGELCVTVVQDFMGTLGLHEHGRLSADLEGIIDLLCGLGPAGAVLGNKLGRIVDVKAQQSKEGKN